MDGGKFFIIGERETVETALIGDPLHGEFFAQTSIDHLVHMGLIRLERLGDGELSVSSRVTDTQYVVIWVAATNLLKYLKRPLSDIARRSNGMNQLPHGGFIIPLVSDLVHCNNNNWINKKEYKLT